MAQTETIRWHELRCRYSDRFLSEGCQDWRILYNFKREVLLTILDQHDIIDFLILDEPKFVLLRIEVDDKILSNVESTVRNAIQENPYFSNLEIVDWSPEDDARNRILGARERAKELRISFEDIPEGGWKIEGFHERKWIAASDDLDKKTKKFANFMKKVVGRFTRAYLDEFPQGVDDRWMLSVFIHLLLNSISVWKIAEKEARQFPYIISLMD